jgi:hypothetical protein
MQTQSVILTIMIRIYCNNLYVQYCAKYLDTKLYYTLHYIVHGCIHGCATLGQTNAMCIMLTSNKSERCIWVTIAKWLYNWVNVVLAVRFHRHRIIWTTHVQGIQRSHNNFTVLMDAILAHVSYNDSLKSTREQQNMIETWCHDMFWRTTLYFTPNGISSEHYIVVFRPQLQKSAHNVANTRRVICIIILSYLCMYWRSLFLLKYRSK